jgi:hypothetical protein
MKQIISFIVLFTIFSNGMLGQSTEKDLERIKVTIDKIDNEKSTYKLIEQFKNSEGSRYSYVENGELKKVSINTQHEDLNKKVDWYFDNGKIIYSEQKWLDSENKIVNNEKIFLSENQIVEWIKTDGQKVDKESQEFIDAELKLMGYANSLMLAIN